MQIFQPSILKGRSHFLPFCLSWPECPDELEGVGRALWQGHAQGSQRFWSSASHRVAVLMLFTPLSLAGVLGVCRSHASPGGQCFVPADAQLGAHCSTGDCKHGGERVKGRTLDRVCWSSCRLTGMREKTWATFAVLSPKLCSYVLKSAPALTVLTWPPLSQPGAGQQSP